MAIKYDEIYSKVMDDELTELELKYVKDAEDHIDKEIINQFGKNSFKVQIDMCVSAFIWSPRTRKGISEIYETRKGLLVNELKKRYVEAGWKIDVVWDDTGGMSSSDYWILSKK